MPKVAFLIWSKYFRISSWFVILHAVTQCSFTFLSLTVSDKLLWYLTQYISDVQEVTAVGTNLGVPYSTIREKLTNNQREIR